MDVIGLVVWPTYYGWLYGQHIRSKGEPRRMQEGIFPVGKGKCALRKLEGYFHEVSDVDR